MQSPQRRSIQTKVLLSLAATGVAAAMAGLGTFATFTATTSASEPVTSGTVTIALGTPGSATNRLTVAATGVVPGDTIERVADLTNTGNQDLASITLTTTASPTSLLDTDTTAGLQMVVERCPDPWVESGSSPAYTYSCGAGSEVMLASRPVIGALLPLTGTVPAPKALNSLTAGPSGVDHLRVTLTLPDTAPDLLQGQSSTITYRFDATQRSAAAR